MRAAGASNQAIEVATSMQPHANCPGPVRLTRRNMLQVGAIGALNLTLPRVLAAGERRSRDGAAPAADSCILVRSAHHREVAHASPVYTALTIALVPEGGPIREVFA